MKSAAAAIVIALGIVLVVGMGPAPASAQAIAIRECGDHYVVTRYNADGSVHGVWNKQLSDEGTIYTAGQTWTLVEGNPDRFVNDGAAQLQVSPCHGPLAVGTPSSADSLLKDVNGPAGFGSIGTSSAASLNCMGANAEQGECLKLFAMGANGTCGGEERPSMSFEDVKNHIEYRCHQGEGVWVRFQRIRTAADHELIKYPVGPCDRQRVVYDTVREKEFLRINEDYSEAECQAHIASLLADALEAKRLGWGDGPAVAFCTVVPSPGDSQGNAYAQVFLFTPSGEGHNGTNTLVFHGLYDTAVNFANSAVSCNP